MPRDSFYRKASGPRAGEYLQDCKECRRALALAAYHAKPKKGPALITTATDKALDRLDGKTGQSDIKLRMDAGLHRGLVQTALKKRRSLQRMLTDWVTERQALEAGAPALPPPEPPLALPPPARISNDSKKVAELSVKVAELTEIISSQRIGVSLTGKLAQKKIDSLRKQAKEGTLKTLRHIDGDGLNLLFKNNSDAASWILRWQDRVTGEDCTMGLGSLADVSLGLAREKRRINRLLIAEGKDPRAERADARLKAQIIAGRAKTVNEVADEYFEAEIESLVPSTRKQAQAWLKKYVRDTIGDWPIQTVDTKTLMDTVGLKALSKEKNPTARQVSSHLHRIFERAIAMNYFVGPNPMDAVKTLLSKDNKAHLVKHHPSLDFRDAGRFMEKLRAYTDKRGARNGLARGARTNVSLAVEFIVLTGVRLSEVRVARWREMDLENKVWNVPWQNRKNGLHQRLNRPIRPIPITAPMLAILEEMRKRRIDPSPDARVFRGQWAGDGGLNRANLSGFIRLQLKWDIHITTHGFRSTLQDWRRNYGVFNEELYEIQADHVVGDNRTQRSYGHDLLIERRREMMEAWGDFCSQLTPPEPRVAEVFRLDDKRRQA